MRLSALLRIPALILLSVGSFLATATWIGSMTPDIFKLRWFLQHKDEVDVVFLGSSHVYRQCDPAQFDRLRGVGEGEPRALNLGLQWMGLSEELYLLERILGAHPEHLRWIVIEARSFHAGMPGEERNDFTDRRLAWHRGDITALLLRQLPDRDLPSEVKWSLARRHIEHWWRRIINLGRGVEILTAPRSLAEEDPADLATLGEAADGFFPLSLAMADDLIMERRKRFESRRGRLQVAVRELADAGDGGPTNDGQLALVRRMEALAEEHGVGLIWWLHPGMERLPGWRQLLEAGEIEHLLAYDDPQRYPDFYRRELHFDFTHLNRRGSARMMQVLTRDFLALTAAESPDAR